MIHDIAIYVAVFTTGVLVGYLWKVVLCNLERMKAERKEEADKTKRSREECLNLVKRDLREKAASAWTVFFISVVLAFLSTFIITYYTLGQNDIRNCQKTVYGLSLVVNTFCIGYISAFAFYYLHDYLPLSNSILEDYQAAFAPVNIVSGHCQLLERKVFGNNVPNNDYEKQFADIITDGTKKDNLVELNKVFWKLIRLNSSLIDDCRSFLLMVRSELNQANFINLGMSLDIYKQISTKNWAVMEDDEPLVEHKDLLLVIKNFKKSLNDYQMLKQRMERYIYLDIYRSETD